MAKTLIVFETGEFISNYHLSLWSTRYADIEDFRPEPPEGSQQDYIDGGQT